MAAVNAVHTDGDATDWRQVVALYDQLLRLDPSPIVRLNRAIAVGERDGAAAGLALLDELGGELAGYHGYHAARADLLRRLGRTDASRAAYDAAIALAGNSAEVAFLERRRAERSLRSVD
jgi:RNA polymerase sigma-70 factor (ECF subfamily)